MITLNYALAIKKKDRIVLLSYFTPLSIPLLTPKHILLHVKNPILD